MASPAGLFLVLTGGVDVGEHIGVVGVLAVFAVE